MAFRDKAMDKWTGSEVAAFFRDQSRIPPAIKTQVMAALADLGMGGDDLLSTTVAELVDAGVSKPAAQVIIQFTRKNKDSFPQKVGGSDSFVLHYDTMKGPDSIRVTARDSVLGLKEQLKVAVGYKPKAHTIRLICAAVPMEDDKVLADYGLTPQHPHPKVSVIFATIGGAQHIPSMSEEALAGLMGKWQPEDVAVWMRTLQPGLKSMIPDLVDKKQMTGRKLLTTSDAQWEQLVPNRLKRRLLLKAIRKCASDMVARAEFDKVRELDLTNPLVEMTMDEECIPFTADSEEALRAKMPCGHAIGPNNLFRYFYTELMDKPMTTELKCAVEKCDCVWPWHIIFAVCGLTGDQVRKYQQILDTNAMLRTTRKCPSCGVRCSKPTDVTHCRVACLNCGKRDFCWECSQTWKGSGFQFCGNEDCDITERINEVLETCDDKDFMMYPDPKPRGPSIRMCPHGDCRTLVGHAQDCKHMKCPACQKEFCFFCLDKKEGGSWGCGDWDNQCPFAPRQKAIRPK